MNNSGFCDPIAFAMLGIVAAIAIPQFVAYKAKAEAVQLKQVAQLCINTQQHVCVETKQFPTPAETPECGDDRLPPNTEWTQLTGDGCATLRVRAGFIHPTTSSFSYKVECVAEGAESPVCTTSRLYK